MRDCAVGMVVGVGVDLDVWRAEEASGAAAAAAAAAAGIRSRMQLIWREWAR
jgi:hypothetical protein